MLQLQIHLLTAWWATTDTLNKRVREERDRGEITSTTAIIVILVVAAIVAGGIIAAKVNDNANNVPSP